MPRTRAFVPSPGQAALAQQLRNGMTPRSGKLQWACPRSWADSADEEVRVDPEDGGTRTLQEVRELYGREYSVQEIDAYWELSCMPLEAEGHTSTETRELREALALSLASAAAVAPCEEGPELASEDGVKRRSQRSEDPLGSSSGRWIRRLSTSTRRPDSDNVSYTLKVSLGLDLRRLRAAWPTSASHVEAMDAIRRSVRDGFDGCLQEPPFLQYTDAEGDVCSLVETTLDDCLTFAQDSTLRIMIRLASHAREGQDVVERALCAANKPEAPNFCIASPPVTPRPSTPGSNTGLEIVEEYSLEWSLVEPTDSPGKA